jgi:DNA-binding beta-propeller fold protein YncE
MKARAQLLISLFAILATPAFSQYIAGYTSLGAVQTHGGNQIVAISNPGSNKIYVSDTTAPGEIIVVNAPTRSVSATIPVGTGGSEIRVNSATNTIYAFNGQSIYVIDGSVDQVVNVIAPVTNDGCIGGIAVDSGANQIVALDVCSKTGYVMDASGNLLSTVSIPLTNNVDYQINPVTHVLYVVDDIDHEFVVADLTTSTSTTISVGSAWPQNIAIDTSLNRIYMADAVLSSVYVYDGATNTLINTLKPPTDPFNVEVNSTNHIVAVSDGYLHIYFYRGLSLAADGDIKFSYPNSILWFSGNSATNIWYTGVLPLNSLAFIAGPRF